MSAPIAPGISVTSLTAPPPANASPSTGTWFVTGQTQRGVVGKPIYVGSMNDFAAKCGTRTPAAATLYDALDLYFRDGGAAAWISRVTGPATATATLVLKDQASTPLNTLNVNANSGGAWGNSVSVAVTVTGSTYVITVSYNGVVVETSPTLTSPADAVNWSSVSNYVTITNANSTSAAPQNNPAALTATALTTGVDDTAGIVEATWTTALTTFTSDMGPGQVSAPGRTTDPAHQALITHATNNNRVALCDSVDTPTATTIVTAATNAASGLDGSRGCLLAPWVIVPGISTGSAVPAANRTVPPSALVAAAISRSDALGNPNRAAAGAAGQSAFAIGVTQTYVDSDRATLNVNGVDVVRYFANRGVCQLYGFRTLSADPNWIQLNWSRLRMFIQDQAVTIGGQIAEFAQLDAKGQVLGRFNGALAGMLQQLWQVGALYGPTAADAFAVNTGPDVNTTATISAGQLNATIAIKRSVDAEFVNIQIFNVPLSQPV